MYDDFISLVREMYKTNESIHLHEPRFIGNEKKYLNDCIDSTFVSSVGKYVTQFEAMVAEFVGVKYAVSTSSGTSALHIGLKLVGVDNRCEVITQPLTFIATANAISYCGAKPIFVDVDKETLGLSPLKLKEFLEEFATLNLNGECINKSTNKIIKACVPMHTFGHPAKIDEIVGICDSYNIAVVEDAAESLGSYYKSKHTGSFGKVGAFSFNGNKIITSGSGGMIVTNDERLAVQAKHITTTAKIPHPYEYIHDEIGYNYRLTNIASAIGVAQMESIQFTLDKQRSLAQSYEMFFKDKDINFIKEPKYSHSNYWLNSVIMQDRQARDSFLISTNNNKIMTRPIWTLMTKLDMYKNAQISNIDNSEWLEARVVNIPSSVLI
jgi:perosamine synthetase